MVRFGIGKSGAYLTALSKNVSQHLHIGENKRDT